MVYNYVVLLYHVLLDEESNVSFNLYIVQNLATNGVSKKYYSLSQLRPNYKLGTLFFGMNRHHRVQYNVRRWWFVLEWTILAKLLLSFPWLLWFEITKVIWKPGCKKANRNCVLLQADDLGNYYVQQIREK